MVKRGMYRCFRPLQRYLPTCQAKSAFHGRFFALGNNNSEGGHWISKWKIIEHFSPSFLGQTVKFKTRDFSLRIKWVLAGVHWLQFHSWSFRPKWSWKNNNYENDHCRGASNKRSDQDWSLWNRIQRLKRVWLSRILSPGIWFNPKNTG